MSLISFNELHAVIAGTGLITNRDGSVIPYEQINAASIDLRLGRKIKTEVVGGPVRNISYRDRKTSNMAMEDIELDDEVGYTLQPGEFILAESEEVFHLPLDISCEYKLKSSMARIGLEHLNAGWADAGWHGSVLTLEFKNMSRNHSITIRPGDLIGQMVFFRHAPVPLDRSYAARGRYNNDLSVSGLKG